MKKSIIAILVLAFCLSFGACGTPTVTQDENNSETVATPSEEKTSDEPSEIEESIIYDENNIKVTVTELDQSSPMGVQIKMLFENNSENDIVMQSRSCIVNGYMIDASMSVDVAAGKKANNSLTLMRNSVTKCGIGKFTDIKFDLVVLNPNSFETIYTSDMITLETSNTGKYTQEYDDSGTLVYDANGIKVVSKGITSDDVLGQSLELYIENNTDKSVVVQCNNASVNGFMIDTVFSTDVLSGAKAVDDMTFMETSLEENGIENITDLEFNLVILDEKNFETIETSDTISLTF